MTTTRILLPVLALALAHSAFATKSDLAPIAQSPNLTQFAQSETPLDQSQTIRIGFGLAGFQKAQADAFVASQSDPNSPNFRQWIDGATFGKWFGAPQSDIDSLTAYLKSQGFDDIKVGTSRCFVTASCTFAQASKAFETTFVNYARPLYEVQQGDPALFYGPAEPIKLPIGLASKVNSAFGFTNLSLAHPAITTKASKQTFTGLSPAQISLAYGSNGTETYFTGKGMNIAVYSPTNWYTGDPSIFAAHFGIPNTFTIDSITVDGGPLSSTNGYGEAALDTQLIIGQAPAATIYLVQPPSGETGVIDGYDAVLTRGTIPILTSSWGRDESALIKAGETSYATTFENACEALVASGVTIFHGAGDTAAYASTDSGKVSVDMESACPYVTGIGGTALTLNSNGAYGSETLWEYSGTPTTAKGGGGGISQIFKMPTWQTGYGVLETGISNGYREEPDVSSNADPSSGYYIVENGNSRIVGGCSSGGPLWSSNLLLMEQFYASTMGKQQRLGNINPYLYELGNWFQNPSYTLGLADYMWHDITVGSNGVYSCTPGYDMCTGWGTVNFAKALRDIGYAANITGQTPDYVPYKPVNWSNPVIFHTGVATPTEPTSFVHGTKYYVGAAIENNGTCDGPSTEFAISINGTVALQSGFPSLAPSTTRQNLSDLTYTFPAAGTYTVTLTVNYTGLRREVNTSNNTFTRTITVN